MLAWEIARNWQSENCMTPFEEILGWHLSGGLVYSTRDCFLLAQEVTWDPEQKAIVESRESRVEGQQPNAWFVELAAASPTAQQSNSPIAEFMRVAPRAHTYVLWYRAARNRPHNIHAYKWDHLARRVNLSPSPLCASAPLRENL
jgi:hypothetical protein